MTESDANRYQMLALTTEKTPGFVSVKDLPTDLISRLMHAQLGIASEGGELADAIKKTAIYTKPLDLTNVMEECGDLLWYIALALHACGFTMTQAMQANIEKLAARYPEGFTEARALNRDIEKERKILEAGDDAQK